MTALIVISNKEDCMTTQKTITNRRKSVDERNNELMKTLWTEEE